jgi:ATP-dependent RNA helicase DbpA
MQLADLEDIDVGDRQLDEYPKDSGEQFRRPSHCHVGDLAEGVAKRNGGQFQRRGCRGGESQSRVDFHAQRIQCLANNGVSALALHGEMEQRERDQVLAQFSNQSCSVLVATDVAARGLDVEGVAAVINVELSPDPAVHIHRIGRSGRAGQPGLALSLVGPAEQGRAASIETQRGSPSRWQALEKLPERLDSPLLPPMRTLAIAGGRKDKLRPGDLVGALTGEAGLPADALGKIAVSDFQALVAVRWDLAQRALQRLEDGRIKGRKFKVRLV